MQTVNSLTLLLVEDDVITSMAESEMLAKYGYTVITAPDGEAALETMKNNPGISLILMDINLGRGMDGTETARIMLHDHDVPVLFVSNHTEPEVIAKTSEITSYGYVVKNSGETVFVASITMALRLFEANRLIHRQKQSIEEKNLQLQVTIDELISREHALKTSEERYYNLFQSMLEGFAIHEIICDENGKPCNYRFLEINPAFTRMTGLDRKTVIGADVLSVIPNLENYWIEIYGEVALTGNPVRFFEYSRGLDKHFEVMAYCPARGLFATHFRDVSDYKKGQAALSESEERYRKLFEAESDSIFLVDNTTGRILEANSAASTMYGYTHAELLSKKNSDLSAEPDETRRVTLTTPIDPSGIITIPLRYHRKKNGSVFPVEITGRFFNWHGQDVHIAAIRDITDRKRAEEMTAASLSEKEAILCELQHRVKNSLFMITGLIELQAVRARNPETTESLKLLKGRISSLSGLYAILTQNGNIESVQLDTYIEEIADSIAQAYLTSSENIFISVHCDNVFISTKTAAPLGLIINEIVTNAIKYAFPDNRPGTIGISLSFHDKAIHLEIRDDGEGLPECFDVTVSGGMGFQLVGMLCSQLGGTYSIGREFKNTVFRLDVPAD